MIPYIACGIIYLYQDNVDLTTAYFIIMVLLYLIFVSYIKKKDVSFDLWFNSTWWMYIYIIIIIMQSQKHHYYYFVFLLLINGYLHWTQEFHFHVIKKYTCDIRCMPICMYMYTIKVYHLYVWYISWCLHCGHYYNH